ncbi:beta-N-acetylhexosaminidase [Fulvivirga sediminis]|uniref:beta-N-acetylhexosaminidase n=1 Tax=Fulvivirga sediminis TaxID=2803949 RepID=A0A937F773_9BACT|nr:family 20 glycosylhydrolase [Fulvivirga sediminis]MBL3655889.1 family 20 glycosylhydrolase [Fulvivirga sediminis]
MRNHFLQLLIWAVLFTSISCSTSVMKQEEYNSPISIIPEPVSLEQGKGALIINENTKLLFANEDEEAKKIAKSFSDQFSLASGITLSIEESAEGNVEGGILFSVNENLDVPAEGYELIVDDKGISIVGKDNAGLFYGMQTLKQLLPPAIESTEKVEGEKWLVPLVSIQDYPRYKWRGLHLDVSRHFSSVDFVKEYIDNMAMHKLNTFHWHLTDDQGWRIEIKKYPKLTEIGAYRDETLVGHAGSTEFDGKRYGGFYTQEEIKEVVAYAKERHITVVPEIELPGHATAAVASYPEVGVTGNRPKVVTEWGVFLDIYGVEDETFEFLQNVLVEVMELFPSKYIHIGGDEAWKDQWKASSKVQEKIKELGLKDEHELQSWFITRIEKFVNSKGRQIIGWDEILEGGLAPNAAVMSWRGEEGGIAAAKEKHYVVMTPGGYVYFDHYQGDPKFEPLQISGYTTLEKVYSYDPTPEVLSEEEKKYILGAQANVWSEYLPTSEMIEYVVFPRVAALSEVLWTPLDNKDWEAFRKKIPNQLKRYEYRGINYAKSIYYVTYDIEDKDGTEKLVVTLKNQFGLSNMYYTTDGSEPTKESSLYEGPLYLDEGTTLKAVVIQDEEPMAKVTEITVEKPKEEEK